MKIAFIDKKSVVIRVEKNILKIDEQKIPLRLLETIVFASSSNLSTNDMVKITKEGLSLILLSSRGDEMAVVHSAKSKNAELKVAQYKALSNFLEVAKYFISQKIIRHAKHLEVHQMSMEVDDVLESIERVENHASLLGIEGTFSRDYFKLFFSLFSKRVQLGKRSRNPPLDPVNAMLSFFYMLTYNLITVRLLSFGFEPSIGFLHKPFRSHNALASDIMELFRADINAFVWRLFDEKLLESSDFTKKNGVYLKYEARKKIWAEYKDFHKSIELQVDEEITKLRKIIGG